MSKLIESLEPEVQEKALAFLQECAKQGILLRVTQGRRTLDEQAALYAKGRTAPGPAVTNAPPGYSWHSWGRAFDVAEMDKTPYDLGKVGPHDDEALWDKIADIAESLGLESGVRWKTPDRPHLQYPGGLSMAQLRKEAKERGELA